MVMITPVQFDKLLKILSAQCVFQGDIDALRIAGLLDKVDGAGAHHLHGNIHRAVRGDNDDGCRDGLFPDVREYFTTIHVGQFQVQQDGVRCLRVYHIQRFLAGHDMGDVARLLRQVLHVDGCQ